MLKYKRPIAALLLSVLSGIFLACTSSQHADLILMNGKIITVDPKFTIEEAVAIAGGKILAVGSNANIRKLADDKTKIMDLKGRTVIPGLIDAHLHPETASTSELDRELPDLHTVVDLLAWIKSQASQKNEGEWITLPKLFFTRLLELRQPTLTELDHAAPVNPVFLDGSFGGMINSAAMRASGISVATSSPGILRDKAGHLTGFIRASAFSLVKLPPERHLTYDEKLDALEKMLIRYNRLGITSICSGSGDFGYFRVYSDLHRKHHLTARVFQNILLEPDSGRTLKVLLDTLKKCNYATGYGDEWVRIGALKIVLDGGILTGTAYMGKPWGKKAREIFGIEDTSYRGILNYTREDVLSVVKAAAELNWKFTAHCTGGGGVDLLLDVFDVVNREIPLQDKRFSIIHGNFFTPAAIAKMKDLGIYADLQPAWFYKDADAMRFILGEERIKSFHPYHSLVNAGVCINGGSDHMVKWDANTSINPYNPFLAMWTMVSRTTERGTVILPEEAITREQALKIYTINNAYASFEEIIKGSIEPGKLADLAVISDDILTCPVDQIRSIQSELTMVGGEVVYISGALQ
jgi:predicted amidohydrolase YtcJ